MSPFLSKTTPEPKPPPDSICTTEGETDFTTCTKLCSSADPVCGVSVAAVAAVAAAGCEEVGLPLLTVTAYLPAKGREAVAEQPLSSTAATPPARASRETERQQLIGEPSERCSHENLGGVAFVMPLITARSPGPAGLALRSACESSNPSPALLCSRVRPRPRRQGRLRRLPGRSHPAGTPGPATGSGARRCPSCYRPWPWSWNETIRRHSATGSSLPWPWRVTTLRSFTASHKPAPSRR